MTPTAFAPLTGPIGSIGFYPVVPDAAWVQRLLDWGVRTVQLRIKAADHTPAEIASQVRAAVAAGRAVPGAQVFINDHWQLALAAGAYGVHLGQEDLDTADLAATYLGAWDFHRLVHSGRAEERREGAAEAASLLFRTDLPPFCAEVF